MKNLQPILAAGLAAGLLLSLGFTQATRDDPEPEPSPHPVPQKKTEPEAPQGDLAARVAALEATLAHERAAAAETRAMLDATVAYLHGRAELSKGVLDSLALAEEAGFTAGINPRSREVLLSGLRGFWDDAARGLPGDPPPATDEDGEELFEEEEAVPRDAGARR